MSNLLEQASLVLIPSGYAEDVVYSEIPLDGSGDMTLTRASNGTRVNSAGLVEVCPWNLLEDSETLNLWATNNSPTITANNLTAPNGTLTADTFQTSANVSGVYKVATVVSGSVYTFTVYIKNISSATSLIIGCDSNPSNASLTYNAVTNTITSVGGGITSSSVQDAGNGWYRVFGTYVSTGSTNAVIIYSGASSSMTFGAWGAQLNIGSTAKPYFPTTDRLNVPRLTYQNGGGGCPSLLLEKQSTNFIVASQEFNNSTYWVIANSVVSANVTTSPDGTQNADLWYPSTNGDVSSRRLLQSCAVSASGINVTATVYVKRNNKRWLFFAGPDATSANHNCWFDIQNGVVGTKGSLVISATVENVGNGWYRCSVTSLATSTTQYVFLSATDADADGTVTANGTDGMYFYGAQAEVSSYPTSYIPTTSASATRVADACFKTSATALIGQTEGTILLDCEILTTDTQDLLSIRPGGTSSLAIGTASNLILGYVIEGATVISMSFANYAINTRYKIALAYKNGECALYVNGTQADTDTTAFTFSTALSSLYLGQSQYFGKSSYENNEVVLFKTRLTNAELASLTTI